MTRLEYKYLVPEEALADVRRRISPHVEPDSHASVREGYTVRSVYFDTADLDFYYQKESGIQHRRKLRVRGYGDGSGDALVFLEIKRKNDMAISKARAPFYYRHWPSLFASGDLARFVHNPGADAQVLRDGHSFFFHLHRYSLMPTVLVCYEREAFFGKYKPGLRVTLDKNLRSAPYPGLQDLFAKNHQKRSLEGHFIIEVKFNEGMPVWLKSLQEHHRLQRQALSKYVIALDEQGIPGRSGTFSTWAHHRHGNEAGSRKNGSSAPAGHHWGESG